ncbi:hypothetical protein WA026_008536 [Henosepilachna vigintioctopunctata]|uniref:Thioredoxin domain-containing protein n=1 Tax=Henosepilachna vigintioctopunctata TaxID=420089 RepID=A0AAW1UG30_9CUCU
MFEFLLQFEVYNIFLITIGAAVIELNDENFNAQIHNQNLSLIIFYTSWCSQCTNLLMKLPEIDRKVQNISPTTNIFTVECDVDGKLTCNNYQIDSYPVLKSFRGDEEYGKFEGNRDVKSILSFMQIEASPVARKLVTSKILSESCGKKIEFVLLLVCMNNPSFTLFSSKLQKSLGEISAFYIPSITVLTRG